jgi:hypothetical protein
VASDGNGRFLVAWTTFVGGNNSFDLAAQRYARVDQPLSPMSAPFVQVPFTLVNGVYQPQIVVSWPWLSGLAVDHYEVYVDGSASPAVQLTTNQWTLSGLRPGTAHSLQVAYVLTSGSRSPLSAAASATTWMGVGWGGIPLEWMAANYGADASQWPAVDVALAPGGPTLLQAFLSGANPKDPSTWLRTELVSSPQGYFLTWNPQPGLTYQVQTATDPAGPWSNLGSPRWAAGSEDSLHVTNGNLGYFRLLLMR